jgi:hypothetical protein
MGRLPVRLTQPLGSVQVIACMWSEAGVIRHMLPKLAFAGLCLCLAGCVTERQTSPLRTATEELLISTAADRAADKLAEQIPQNIKAYLDTYIDAPDGIYASRAIRDRLLRRGIVLVDNKAAAEVVIEVRSGALSTDEKTISIGTPQLVIPAIPGPAATNGFPVPAITLFRKADIRGVAKFAATAYDTRTGKLVVTTDPQFGYSKKTDWVVLLIITWSDQDYLGMTP